MRKINNGQKFHNNNNSNNTIYSLNYKFDSVCSAGKFSGTALDLIKKYNELAKEAHSNGNYVEMEVFRQYAEHYRKIVTEINERKNQNRDNRTASGTDNKEQSPTEETPVNNGLVETEAAAPAEATPQNAKQNASTEEVAASADNQTNKPRMRRRGFTLVEVSTPQEQLPTDESVAKPRRGRRPLMKKNTDAATADAEASNA